MSVSMSWRCHLFNAVICECCEGHASFSKVFLTTGLGNMEMGRLLSHCRLFPILKIGVSRASTSFPGSLLEEERPWLHVLMSSWRGFPSTQSPLPIFLHLNNEIMVCGRGYPRQLFRAFTPENGRKTQPRFGFLPSVTCIHENCW